MGARFPCSRFSTTTCPSCSIPRWRSSPSRASKSPSSLTRSSQWSAMSKASSCAFTAKHCRKGQRGARESLIHLHINRLDAEADRQKLIDGVTRSLHDVRACVTDWRAMRDRVEEAIKTFASNPPPLPIDEVAEANQFLQWLCADNFTFLGVREYRFSPDGDAPDDITTNEGLGILRDPDAKVLRRGSEMVVMTSEIREFMREPTLLIVIKANVSSRVHRRIRMDYVGIKLYTPDGRLEGELGVVALFTSGA